MVSTLTCLARTVPAPGMSKPRHGTWSLLFVYLRNRWWRRGRAAPATANGLCDEGGAVGRDVADCSGCIGFAFEARARGCQRATSAAPKTVYIHTNCCTGFNVHPPEFRRKTRKWLKEEEWTGSNSSSTVWRTRVKKSTYTCLLRTHVYVVVLYLVGVLSIFVCIYIYTYDRCLQSDVFFRFCLQGIFISERDFIKCYTLCVCHCFQVKSTSSSPLLNTVTVPVPNEKYRVQNVFAKTRYT